MIPFFHVSLDLIRPDMYAFAALFILAGISHFFLDHFFLRIMPKWVPFPRLINYVSGFFEVLLGFSLFPDITRSYAGWSLFFLLLAVWPANFYHYFTHTRKDPPKWILLLRLPMQIPLLYWAYSFT